MEFKKFTKRTNYPKLGYLQMLLHHAGIEYRINGESWHAPILEVDASKIDAAWEILSTSARKLDLPCKHGVRLDDVPDDHRSFDGFDNWAPDDESNQTEAEYLAELERGYAQDRI